MCVVKWAWVMARKGYIVVAGALRPNSEAAVGGMICALSRCLSTRVGILFTS